ncbi:MAG TPA: DUF305 domain-containing protein [Roseiarcus sp.]|jgi:uncharacterized protein (DUF305 family)
MMRHSPHLLAAIAAIASFGADPPLARAQQGAAQPSTTAAAPTRDLGAEAPFLAENNTAMAKMMAGMAVKPTGDVDADFAAMMIPHHQGAIDMALAELRHGKNEQLRRIAQEIIVDQQQEIAAMRLALGQPLPSSTAAPTQAHPQPPAKNAPASSMQMRMPMPMPMKEDASR